MLSSAITKNLNWKILNWNCLKKGLRQFENLRRGAWQKRGGSVFEGGGGGLDTPMHTMMSKCFLSIFPKMLFEIFSSRIC